MQKKTDDRTVWASKLIEVSGQLDKTAARLGGMTLDLSRRKDEYHLPSREEYREPGDGINLLLLFSDVRVVVERFAVWADAFEPHLADKAREHLSGIERRQMEHSLRLHGPHGQHNPIEWMGFTSAIRTFAVFLRACSASLLGAGQQNKATDAPSADVRKKRPPLTLQEAAEIVGKSVPTVRNWEAGRHTPEGWPGRGDGMTLKAWSNRREEGGKLKRALRETIRTDDVDRMSRWAKDDA